MGNTLSCGARAHEVVPTDPVALATLNVEKAWKAVNSAKTETKEQADAWYQRALKQQEVAIAKRDVEKAWKALNSAKTAKKEQAADAWYQRALKQQEDTIAKQEADNENDFNARVAFTPSIQALESHIDSINPQIRNYWDMDNKKRLVSSPPQERTEGMRSKVAKYYRCAKKISPNVYNATCCVTGLEGNNQQVIAAHLLPRSAPPKALDIFEFDSEKGFDDLRNVVLLAYNIEKAFDQQRLCFVMSEDTGSLLLAILDPSVEEEPVFEGSDSKIGHFQGHEMTFNEGVDRPYFRVLSHHAKCSFIEAKKKGWIPNSARMPSEYDYGSPLKNNVIRVLNQVYSFSDTGSNVIKFAGTSTTGGPESVASGDEICG